MKRCCHSSLTELASIVLFTFLLVPVAVGQEEKRAPSTRVLSFPDDKQVGVLEVFKQSELEHLDAETSERRPAFGRIEVPVECFASLTVGAVDDLAFLDNLAVDALQKLRVRGMKIDQQAFAHIARFTGLQELRVESCEVSGDAFDSAPVLPQLMRLTVSTRDGTKEHLGSLANWLPRLPRINTLYATPALDAIAIQKINGHRTLETITVDVSKNGQAIVFKLIDSLPALRGLIVSVSKSVSPRALDRLASVPNLRSLTLVDATVDGELLHKLSESGTLQELRLLVIEPGSGFHSGLRSIRSLEQFYLSTNVWDDSDAERAFFNKLPATLLELPRVREFPKLKNLTVATFAKIAERRNIESLDISGLARGFDLEVFSRLQELNQLKTLRLTSVPIDDDDLKIFSGLVNLEYLSLVHSKVRGPGLSHLQHLPKLKRLQIMMDRRRIEPELSGLESLKQLSRFQLFGLGFRPEDFYPVANCLSLRHLAMSDGQLDDSVIGRISKLPHLRIIHLWETQLTDASLVSLATNPNLESISLSGDFSAKGIELLSELRKLTTLHVRSPSLSASDIEELPNAFPITANIGFRIE